MQVHLFKYTSLNLFLGTLWGPLAWSELNPTSNVLIAADRVIPLWPVYSYSDGGLQAA